MTKKELVKEIARMTELRKKDVEAVLNAFFEVITESLQEGKRVHIRNFGTFLMKKRAARVARNPKTGKKIKIPPKLVPVFKPGKSLREIEKVR